MSESAPSDKRAVLKEALIVIERLKARLAASELQQHEPIAIIGVGCRFPGSAGSPAAFFAQLQEGRESVTEIPDTRFPIADYYAASPEVPGKINTRQGSFLKDVYGFDAAFFRVSPREARLLDPQQRLLLEVSWEALEHAGIDPQRLGGSLTSVVCGVTTSDHLQLCAQLQDPHSYGLQRLTGSGQCFASGRLAHFLDLRGSALTVDTACSSSLVALHLGIGQLRQHESDLAIVGGVNLMLYPDMTINLAQGRMLAPDGRCKAFDASADGFGRGEGCGVVILKRLSDAVAASDSILAVLRGSAVRHDGRAAGITVPNGPAQEAVLRAALADAGVNPGQIDYIEAHGTGTPLGDPIEIEAIKRVYLPDREPSHPLLVGAVKTNIGHLEAAAGIAGVIKVVLSLQAGEIPRHLHLRQLNPEIALAGLPMRIVEAPEPWPRCSRPRLAGVSAFGASGTNAHVILAEAPEVAPVLAGPDNPPDNRPYLVPLSAKSEAALRALAERYLELPPASLPPLVDLGYSAACHRSHHDHRLAVVAGSATEYRSALLAYLAGRHAAGPGPSGSPPRVVFVFPGQGGQWVGMARRLLVDVPVFRRTLGEIDAELQHLAGWSLLAELSSDHGGLARGELDRVQPALFAISVALATTWQALGVEPEAVIGHSMGEVAAACVAGALKLADGVRVIYERSRLLRQLGGQGAMASIGLPEAEVRQLLAETGGAAQVAACNSRRSTVVAGTPDEIADLMTMMAQRSVFCRRIQVDVASHSPQVDALRPELLRALSALTPTHTKVAMFSTVHASAVAGEALDAAYFVANLRQPVLFVQTLAAILASGSAVFIEMGPHPVLVPNIEEELQECRQPGIALASLQRDCDERASLLSALGRAYESGVPVAWPELYGAALASPRSPRRVELPTYPFLRSHYAVALSPRVAPPPKDDALAGERWLYELRWRVLPPGPTLPRAKSHFLLVGESDALAAELGAALVMQGHSCKLVQSADALAQDLPRAADSGVGVCVILLGSAALAVGTADLASAAAAQSFCKDVLLPTAQQLARLPGPLFVVTRAAQPVAGEGSKRAVGPALWWGFVRALFTEHPALAGALIDLEPRPDPQRDAHFLAAALCSTDGEDQLASRGAQRYVARLERSAPPSGRQVTLRPDATYVVTGGLGGIGVELLRFLCDRGARHLCLLGRRRPADLLTAALNEPLGEAARKLLLLHELRARGVEVGIVTVDVSCEEALRPRLAEALVGRPPVRGVFHAAGVALPAPLAALTPALIDDVLAAKVAGTINLWNLLRSCPLDHFVMFSSAAAIWGAKHTAPYAAANHFLDAWAHQLRDCGVSALSINWGRWHELQIMQDGARAAEAFLARVGLSPMPAAAALQLLGRLMADGVTQRVVADVDWQTFRPIYESQKQRPLFQGLDEAAAAAAPALTGTALWQQLGAAPPVERLAILKSTIAQVVAAVLGFDNPAELDLQSGFFHLGMDSVMAVEVTRRLGAELGIRLYAPMIFNHSTVVELAGHLSELVHKGPAPADNVAPPQTAPASASTRGSNATAGDAAGQLAEELARTEEYLKTPPRRSR